MRGNDEGWGSPLIVSLLGGGRSSAASSRSSAGSPSRCCRSACSVPAFTGVQLAAFAVSGSLFALFPYLTLYLQNFLGFSPVEAGVRYLPITVASFLVAPLAGMALAGSRRAT